ncbi:MAG: 4Fe-4S binding protein [Archaeoglobus sp.]|nr:4Fe-4S binding protein [Archaeoglobus sp.]
MTIAVLNCQGCGTCDKVCKFGAIIRNGSKVAKIDAEKCQECYDCVKACPYGALVIMD